MEVEVYPNYRGKMFTRNPLFLRVKDCTSPVSYTIYDHNSESVFSGVITEDAVINIADIIETMVPLVGDADETKIFTQFYSLANTITLSLNYVTESEPITEFKSFLAYRGGVSKQNYSLLLSKGTDIFAERFAANNCACNFFMTTRTKSWQIAMKETELYPLFFLSPVWFIVRDVLSQKEVSVLGALAPISALSIEAVRTYMFTEYGVISNSFDVILRDGTPACRIVIVKSDSEKERYRLKFRNSYGVYEIIEIAGELSVTPSIDSDEEQQFCTYDNINDDFQLVRDRAECENVITVVSGFKRHDEILFFLDMLASDEVYLLDFAEYPVRVIASAEDLTYKPNGTEPQTFTLKLTLSENDRNLTQYILGDGSDFVKPDIFSDEFDEHFN